MSAKRVLLFDPFAGISGDMMLAALLDLGLSEDWLRSFVAELRLGDVAVDVQPVLRRGIACPHVRFRFPEQRAHRHLRQVVEIVERGGASALAQSRARTAFEHIARAEARVHGTTVERVHFHEVGALDAILDVLCSMAGVEALGFEAFFTRPVAVGSGWIDIEHGRFPVPAPATLEILRGVEITGHELRGECTTPTGAAILATLAGGSAPPPGLRVLRTGFGAGSRDPEDRPNCLRLVACDLQEADEPLWLVQSDLDDFPAEYAPAAQAAVLAAGALDSVVVPISMKKGRPGMRLEALAPASALDAVTAAMFRSTSTIGLRYWPVTRPALERSEQTLEFRGQPIRFKYVVVPGGGRRRKPEYDDVVRAAAALGMEPYELRLLLESTEATDAAVE